MDGFVSLCGDGGDGVSDGVCSASEARVCREWEGRGEGWDGGFD